MSPGSWKTHLRKVAGACILEEGIQQPVAGLAQVSAVDTITVAIDHDPTSSWTPCPSLVETKDWNPDGRGSRFTKDFLTLVSQLRRDQKSIWRKPDDRATTGEQGLVGAQSDGPFENCVSKSYTPPSKEIIQGRHIGAASVWHPPEPRVLIVEPDLLHHGGVVPVGKDDDAQASLNLFSHPVDLIWVELLLWVNYEQGAIEGKIYTGEGLSGNLHIEALSAEVLVQFPEVGVDVVTVPVQWVIFHLEVVSWKVARWVSQVVKLVPEKASVPGRRRNDLHPDGQADRARAGTSGLDG